MAKQSLLSGATMRLTECATGKTRLVPWERWAETVNPLGVPATAATLRGNKNKPARYVEACLHCKLPARVFEISVASHPNPNWMDLGT